MRAAAGHVAEVAADPADRHPTYGSSFVQTGIATVPMLAFLAFHKDQYGELYELLAILGTMAILIVQTLTPSR